MAEIINLHANEVRVGDVIWDAQEHRVTEVKELSNATAITADRIGKPGVSIQWVVGNWQHVPVTREPATVTLDLHAVALLVTAARAVIANWDHGDLAAAVRDLDAALREGAF